MYRPTGPTGGPGLFLGDEEGDPPLGDEDLVGGEVNVQGLAVRQVEQVENPVVRIAVPVQIPPTLGCLVDREHDPTCKPSGWRRRRRPRQIPPVLTALGHGAGDAMRSGAPPILAALSEVTAISSAPPASRALTIPYDLIALRRRRKRRPGSG
jgi:hypothetical protein